MPGLAIAIGEMISLTSVEGDILVGNNLEFVDGSNILFIDGSFMLQAES